MWSRLLAALKGLGLGLDAPARAGLAALARSVGLSPRVELPVSPYPAAHDVHGERVMNPSVPRSPLRLRLYAWAAGMLLGSLEGALAVAAGVDLPASVPVALALCAAAVVGALLGPSLSRLLGRRTAGLVGGALVVAGSAVVVVLPGAVGAWLPGAGAVGASTAGAAAAGMAGVAACGAGAGLLLLVVPQVCHELSLPGHRRLMPQAMALMPAGAALVVLGAVVPGAVTGTGLQAPQEVAGLADPLRAAWAGVVMTGAVYLGVGLSLPESPVWLVGRGRDVRAFEALRRLHGNLEAAVAVDWSRHEAGMAREQQRLSAADLRVPQIRQATVTSVVLVVAQEAPLGAAALVLAPAVAHHLGAGAAVVAAACLGWCLVSVLALLLGRVRALERLRFLRVVLGSVVAVVSASLLVAAVTTAGSEGLSEGLSGGVLAGTVTTCLVALVGGQYALVLPACQGAVDPRIPPWLVDTQRRLVAVGQSLARAGAITVPLVVYHRWGLEVLGGAVLTLTVVSMAVVLLRMPRELLVG